MPDVFTPFNYTILFNEVMSNPTATKKASHGEVYTPLWLVDEMLDQLPIHVWTNPSLKWYEPACGLAPFLYQVYQRLSISLSTLLPNKDERTKHILESMLYFNEIQEKNLTLIKRIFGGEEFKLNIFEGSFFSVSPVSDASSFRPDIVLCNPPYSTDPTKATATTLYHKFVLGCLGASYLMFITPARWFSGGKGLNAFRKLMLESGDVTLIRFVSDSKLWFKDVKIEGGVCYFLIDTKSSPRKDCLFNGTPYKLSKYPTLILPQFHSTLEEVSMKGGSLLSICDGRCFGIESNDARLLPAGSVGSVKGSVKCYVSLQKSKTRYLFLEKYSFTPEQLSWRVVTAGANGRQSRFGVLFLAKPGEVHTGSYISFHVGSESEGLSLISYLKTKFANMRLSILKITQSLGGNVCSLIPLVPLDRIWNDEMVEGYLKQ